MDRVLLGIISKITIGGNDPLKEGFAMKVGGRHRFKDSKGKDTEYEVAEITWDEAAFDLYGINRYLVYVKDLGDPDFGIFLWDSFEGYSGISLQYFKPEIKNVKK